jgi:hypothetical protein
MNEIQIETDIPLPPIIQRRKKYPFANMDIGDSFFAVVEEGLSKSNKMASIRCCAHSQFSDRKYVCRAVINGVRCWRIV